MDSDGEGTPFGRYRLVELLGRGGMGEVWRAYDTLIGRTVALKVLPANYADDPEYRERFRREAHKAASLNQRHVVAIFEIGEVDGRLFVTMPVIKGRDLQTVLGAGPLQPQRAVGIVEQVAEALAAAHAEGLVHRDVKPSNILLTEDDFTYLIDFGIARAAGETGLTSTGVTVGTWGYMAPERFRDGQIEPSSDIYALTCVLYQCLTGQPPFPGETLEQVALAHMVDAPPKPSTHDPAGMPAAMDEVIAMGMAKDPSMRYHSTIDLAAAARAALTTVPPAAPSPTLAGATATALEPQPTLTPSDGIPARSRSLVPARSQHPPGGGAAWVRSAHRRHRTAVVLTALAVTLFVVIAMVTVVLSARRQQPSASGPVSQPSASVLQTVLPFVGLSIPEGVAVDGTGAVYVADSGNDRVVMLRPGSTHQTVLPFSGLNGPGDVAVDGQGAVYVSDYATIGSIGKSRILKLAAGSGEQTVLPFSGLNAPGGVAVDDLGDAYVADVLERKSRVVRLAAGSSEQTVLPFTGLNTPEGVAVDSTGAVYAADTDNNRIVKLDAGSTQQTVLPFTGLDSPEGVAVDSTGTVYVADTANNRIVKFDIRSSQQTVLPFTGLYNPTGIAVDNTHAVYVADFHNNRVVKLQQ
uniref:non-specific serine/threonine protein kinase n=1 Tax=Mycobacterium riyadhense TaxID=486698 RepID=A0A653EZH0_9MYCO|nr:Serine/threonine-protein kinase PknD [Mycobacterium riyadhense]